MKKLALALAGSLILGGAAAAFADEAPQREPNGMPAPANPAPGYDGRTVDNAPLGEIRPSVRREPNGMTGRVIDNCPTPGGCPRGGDVPGGGAKNGG